MDLLLIRHGAAEDRRDDLPDAERALTAKGRRAAKKAMRGLEDAGVRLDLLLHSPWLRAVQTAELAALLVVDGRTEVTSGLVMAPDALLLAQLTGPSVAVVGHEPWLSQLGAWLVTGDLTHADRLPLDKAGILWLQGEPRPRGMAVYAALPPRLAKRLRR